METSFVASTYPPPPNRGADDSDSRRSETDAGVDGSQSFEDFLGQHITSNADGTITVKVNRKYVTKQFPNWSEQLRPLFRAFEQNTRRTFLMSLSKHCMEPLVSYYFKQFEENPEDAWILDLARRRFRDNTNSWKSRTLKRLTAHVEKLEKESDSFCTAAHPTAIQHELTANFKIDEFEVIFTWVQGWIDISKSSAGIIAWCKAIYIELGCIIKRHLTWKRRTATGKPAGKRLDWKAVLYRWDDISRTSGPFGALQVNDVKQIALRPRVSELTKRLAAEDDTLRREEDDGAFTPDAAFFQAMGLPVPDGLNEDFFGDE